MWLYDRYKLEYMTDDEQCLVWMSSCNILSVVKVDESLNDKCAFLLKELFWVFFFITLNLK